MRSIAAVIAALNTCMYDSLRELSIRTPSRRLTRKQIRCNDGRRHDFAHDVDLDFTPLPELGRELREGDVPFHRVAVGGAAHPADHLAAAVDGLPAVQRQVPLPADE